MIQTMRHALLILIGVALSIPATGQAAGFERYYLIKLYDFHKEYVYQVLSKDELKALETELKAESKLFRKALDAAKDEWRDDEFLSGSFPSSAVTPRKLRVMGTPFRKREDAQEKLETYEDRDMRSAERKAEREEEREKRVYSGTDGQERLKREKARDARKEEKEMNAREIFERTMEAARNPPEPKGDGDKD